MVVEGKFEAAIIYADTKEAFLEHKHTKTGQIYCEVEPNAEYFVRVASKSKDPIVAKVKIDEVELDSIACLSNNGNSYIMGIASRDVLGGWTTKSFKFEKSLVVQENEENKGIPPELWTGSVEVSFYEGVRMTRKKSRRAFESSWVGNTENVGYMSGKTNPDKKKGVMSVVGNTVEYRAPLQPTRMKLRRGGIIKTIHLKYCSTIGLIYAGILQKPPVWTWHRMNFPGLQNDHSDKIDSIDLSPQKLQTESSIAISNQITSGANVVSPGTFHDGVFAKRKSLSLLPAEENRDKNRRKLERKKKPAKEDITFLGTIKDDSEEDTDDEENCIEAFIKSLRR